MSEEPPPPPSEATEDKDTHEKTDSKEANQPKEEHSQFPAHAQASYQPIPQSAAHREKDDPSNVSSPYPASPPQQYGSHGYGQQMYPWPMGAVGMMGPGSLHSQYHQQGIFPNQIPGPYRSQFHDGQYSYGCPTQYPAVVPGFPYHAGQMGPYQSFGFNTGIGVSPPPYSQAGNTHPKVYPTNQKEPCPGRSQDVRQQPSTVIYSRNSPSPNPINSGNQIFGPSTNPEPLNPQDWTHSSEGTIPRQQQTYGQPAGSFVQMPFQGQLQAERTHPLHCTESYDGSSDVESHGSTNQLLDQRMHVEVPSPGREGSNIFPVQQSRIIQMESVAATSDPVSHGQRDKSPSLHAPTIKENVGERKRTVKIKGYKPKTSKKIIRAYFENKKNCGGKISSILPEDKKKMIRIIFEKAEDAENVVKGDHKISGCQLQLELQDQPAYYQDKIVLKDISPETDDDRLQLFLKAHTRVSVKQLIKSCHPETVFVEFDSPIDFEELERICQKETLSDRNVRPEKIEVSTTLKVFPVEEENDEMEIYFSSFGPVEDVEFYLAEGYCLVFFAREEDALKAKETTHDMENGNVLTAQLYHYCLDEISMNETSQQEKQTRNSFNTPKPYRLTLQHADAKQFLLANKHFQEAISDNRAKVSTVDAEGEDAKTLTLECTIKHDEDAASLKAAQWEGTLSEVVQNLIINIDHVVLDIPEEIVRENHSALKDIEESSNKEEVIIQVVAVQLQVRITGLKEQVADSAARIRQLLQRIQDTHTEQIDNVPQTQWALLEQLNLRQILEDTGIGNVTVTYNNKTVAFQGHKENEVLKAKNIYFEKLLSTKKRDLKSSQQKVAVYKHPQVKTQVDRDLDEKKYVATWEVSDSSLVIFATGESDLEDAERIIQQSVQEHTFQVEVESSQYLDSKKWKKFVESLKSSGDPINIQYDQQNVTVVTPLAVFAATVQRIEEMLAEGSIAVDHIAISSEKRDHLLRFNQAEIEKIRSDLESCMVDITFPAGSSDIVIRGTARGRKKAGNCLIALADKVVSRQHEIIKPGCRSYFESEKGRQTLADISKKTQCSIEFITSAGSGELIHESVALKYMEADITQQKVDVLVNAANGDLQHCSALALDIVRKGGEIIQEESTRYVQQNGRLMEGDIAITSAGRLPAKQVIHAVGPVWRGGYFNEENKMKTLVKRILQKVDDLGLSSVAIPAISTGVFGYPLEKAIVVIVDTVKSFLSQHKGTMITEIVFCDKNPDAVAAFGKALYSTHGELRHVSEVAQEGQLFTLPPPVKEAQATPVLKPKPKPEILQGSIVDQRVDAIVNNITTNLDLQGGVIGRQLVARGGDEIQNDLLKEYTKGTEVGTLIPSTAGRMTSCKALLHVCLPYWNPDNVKAQKMLEKLMRECLEEASFKGYNSIAFPALGTGRLGYPENVVAKIMVESVDSFFDTTPQSTISRVKFVLYEKDLNIIQAFENVHQVSPHTPLTQGFPLKTSLDINIVEGEIAKHSADVIVVPVAATLELDKGAVARSVAAQAGSDLQKECKKHSKGFKTGDVLSINSGKMASKELYLVNIPDFGGTGSIFQYKETVKSCLSKASQMNHSSIAFPMMGTGNLGYTGRIAAEAMLQAFVEFSHGQPKELRVDIVLYPKDKGLIQDVRQVYSTFKSPKSQEKKIPRSETRNFVNNPQKPHEDSDLRFGNVILKVKKGDIVKEKVQAVVHVTERMDFNQGALSLSLKETGGGKLIEECQMKRTELRERGRATTKVSNMKFEYLIHIKRTAVMENPSLAIYRCLQEAESNRISAVAFPIFGGGDPVSKADNMSKWMQEALLKYISEAGGRSSVLKKVAIICYDEQSYNQLAKNLGIAVKTTWKESFLNIFKPGSSSSHKESSFDFPTDEISTAVVFRISADSQQNIYRCISSLDSVVRDEIITTDIERSIIKQLTPTQMSEMTEFAKTVNVQLMAFKSKGQFVLEGLPVDVLQASGLIYDRLSSIQKQNLEDEKIAIASRLIQWCFMERKMDAANNDYEDVMEPYDDRINEMLEAAYIGKLRLLELDAEEGIYVVDFVNMVEYKKNDPNDQVKVFRKNKLEASSFYKPMTWQDMQKNVQVFNVDPATEEFSKIKQNFIVSTGSNSVKVIKIERIQNKTLYSQYHAKKTELMEKYPGSQVEKKMYHGTAADAVNNINTYGFNRSYCGKNAIRFGNGVYFAVHARYSAYKRYSPPDPGTQNQHVYLARVLVGEYTVGYEGLRDVPDKKPPSQGKYDSVVDDMDDSKRQMHVIFYDNQAYPDYLITFTS